VRLDAWPGRAPSSYPHGVARSHRARVEDLLTDAESAHRDLLAVVPADVAESLPVDAQGITRAIDHLADAVGFTAAERRRLVQPHVVNPAVLHARVFGAAPLTADTVIGAFVDGARVRADALITLAEAIGDQGLIETVGRLLIENPLPTPEEGGDDEDPKEILRDAYAAQERAALLIAARLDAL
jgi:hypothetical protein